MNARTPTARSASAATALPRDMDEARALVRDFIRRVAPNLDVEAIDRLESLHDVDDFDSLDFVHLMAVAFEVSGVSVAPRDYPLVITVDGFAAYLLDQATRNPRA